MEKLVYVVTEQTNGDEFTICVSFSAEEARKTAKLHREKYLTAGERKKTETEVKAYIVNTEDGETAKEAFDKLLDDAWLPDPVIYEKIN